MVEEQWKAIVGYEGIYEVSDQGRVRSVDRVVSHGHRRRGRILRPCTNNKGYPMVSLASAGKSRSLLVHRLVLIAFRGPCPEGMEACHGNGIRTDVRLDNLRWDTPKENGADRVAAGTAHTTPQRGSANASSKLHERDLDRILDLRRNGCTQTQIGQWFGVTHRVIGRILNGERWSHAG